ncbi:MAG: hypothetical protein IKK34_07125 [Clostridia bacterium]|nr:hypothetical protein [Clostridia bacterium]
MQTRFSVQVNGQELHDIAESIYIVDVREEAPDIDIRTSGAARPYGRHITGMRRETLTVEVVCEVHEYDVTARAAVVQQMAAWAQDGYLTVNYRPGQRLRCVCEVLPSVGSALRWTERIAMRFVAVDLPFWEDATAVSATDSGVSAYGLKRSAGSGFTALEARAEAEITATGHVTIVTLQTDRSAMVFTGLNMSPGETLYIKYGLNGMQEIYISGGGGTRSAMHCRTGESADDLLLTPGTGVAFTSDGSASATFLVRRLYA